MTTRDVSPHEPHARQRGEAVRLVQRIQALTFEIHELRQQADAREVHAKERTLEQLRWRLATVARRSASDDLGAAA